MGAFFILSLVKSGRDGMASSRKMAHRFVFILLAASAIAFILAGCINVPANDQLGKSDWTIPKYVPADQQMCLPKDPNNPCIAMICKKHPWWISSVYSTLTNKFDASLKNGECNFEPFSPDRFAQLLADRVPDVNNPNPPPSGDLKDWPRTLMFGYGPSFHASDSANLYCNYSLQLAVKWMRSVGGPPHVQAPSRAMCWLDRNVIPVYIYYTGGQYIDSAQTGLIAKEFNDAPTSFLGFLGPSGAGPIMLTTELNFDSSNPTQVQSVKDQLAAIRANCEKCKTILAVQSGDTNALAQILGPPGNPTPEYKMVDVVGFGFRANDYATCDPLDIIGKNYIFSNSILTSYSKPSIWLYVGASEGKSLGGCTWTPEMVYNFYNDIYSASTAMTSSGIIGVSFYQFTDGTGQLPCDSTKEGCNFGVLLANSSQKHPEMNIFSELCTAYGSQEYRNPIIFSSDGQGAECDMMNTAAMANKVSYQINSNTGFATTDVTPITKAPHAGCGEVCPSESKMSDANVYDSTGNQFSSARCKSVPAIDDYGDDLDFSAAYFRAIVEQESNFDSTAVSCAPISANCNKYNLPLSEICRLAGIAPADCPNVACPSGQKVCAFGLSQLIDYPGQFYVENPQYSSEERKDVTGECGGKNYNPFDPSENVCAGMHLMRANLDSAVSFVEGNWGSFTQCDPSLPEGDKGWMEYYLASLNYYGCGYRSQLSAFTSQCTSNDGKKNFIDYLRTKAPACNPAPGYDYSAEIMSRFADLVDKCTNTDCVGK